MSSHVFDTIKAFPTSGDTSATEASDSLVARHHCVLIVRHPLMITSGPRAEVMSWGAPREVLAPSAEYAIQVVASALMLNGLVG